MTSKEALEILWRIAKLSKITAPPNVIDKSEELLEPITKDLEVFEILKSKFAFVVHTNEWVSSSPTYELHIVGKGVYEDENAYEDEDCIFTKITKEEFIKIKAWLSEVEE